MPCFNSYEAVLDYINRFTNYEEKQVSYKPRNYNLLRMQKLLEKIGNPQEKLKAIHIAGTKGKGSIAIMLSTILKSMGCRVGMYTSPHLIDLRERIQVNQNLITKNDFISTVNSMSHAIDSTRPTFFEFMTACAFKFFEEKQVDFSIFEVGLGGRLDATNILSPLVSIINTVSYDHTDKLGTKLSQIAYEKAGIIKEEVPCVVGPQPRSALKVIQDQASRKNSMLYLFGRDFRVNNLIVKNRIARFLYQDDFQRLDLQMPFCGIHQVNNAAVSLMTLHLLNVKQLDQSSLNNIFKRLKLPGRLQIISCKLRHHIIKTKVRWGKPYMIIDSAHNAISSEATANYIKHLNPRRLILIFGASYDKDVRKLLKTLLPLVDLAIFTRSRSSRAMDEEEIRKHADSILKVPAVSLPDVKSAVIQALELARKSDIILTTGSFYVAGEALEFLSRKC